MHVRQQILQALGTAITGLATTGSRVYQRRTLALADGSLPALVYAAESDTPDYEAGAAGCRPLRVLTVAITALAADETDAVIDQVLAEVETAAFAASYPVEAMQLGDTEFAVDGEGDGQYASGTLRLVFEYRTAEGAPEVAA
ncbi:MAG: hypothetical protein D6744_02855 [Planctomycetota bacterium]|nr:MAG: hypothetical protein D6744_02855 [Planctomycetota bacterium]